MKSLHKVLERQTKITSINEDLKNSVTKTEFNELKDVVKELSEAQRKSEERINKLEKIVKELTETQKRNEESLNKLVKRVDKIEEQLGEFSDNVFLFFIGYVFQPCIEKYIKKNYLDLKYQ